MDLLTVSAIYHAGGTMLLLRLAFLAAALLLAMAIHRWLGPRWPAALRLGRRSLAVLGSLAAAWLATVELVVFRAASLLCLVASLALLAGFALGWPTPRWRRSAVAGVLFVAGLGYLFPFGTVPKVFPLGAAAPAADGYSAHRLQGEGEVLVQEFGDFQCPACADMDRTLERLLERNPGRVRLVFRHLPLRSIHPWAQPAALASECAAWQGRFPEAKRLLFTRQGEIGVLAGDPDHPSWAMPDGAEFRSCVEERHAERAVEEDVAEARRLGLRSTPSLVVGPILVVGSTSLPRLEAVLDLAERGVSSTADPHVVPAAGGIGRRPTSLEASCSEATSSPCSSPSSSP